MTQEFSIPGQDNPNSSALGSLAAMNARREEWLANKPQFDSGNELRPKEGDLIFFNFVASGNDGDQFLKLYKAHGIDAVSNKGTRYQAIRYCPISNQEGNECPYCSQGHTANKERMSVWMYVQTYLHMTLPKDKQFPQIMYEGRAYFKEDVGDFRIWHTSAWRESPWADIINIGSMYEGLHNFTAKMMVVGRELTTRFKVYAVPNSAFLSPELYAKAKEECTPIPQLLKEQMSSPVAVNPTASNTQVATPSRDTVNAWSPPGAITQVFTPPAATPAATEPVTESQGSAPAQEQPAEDPHRPLASLF